MLPRSNKLLGRTLGQTFGVVGSLAQKLGLPKKALLILVGITALVLGVQVVLSVMLLLVLLGVGCP